MGKLTGVEVMLLKWVVDCAGKYGAVFIVSSSFRSGSCGDILIILHIV